MTARQIVRRVQDIRALADDLSREVLREKPSQAASDMARAIVDHANALLRALR